MPLAEVMRSPRSVDISITSKCNLRCKYCFYFDRPDVNYIDLPTKEWLKFFDELGKLAVMNVCLAGGEPFLRSDLNTLLEGIVHNHMRFSILSNGSLINDDIAKIIAYTKRCDYVQISLDGSCAEIHDTYRGHGSFEGAIRGIRTLQRQNLPVTVRVTIHHKNVHDLENIAHLLLDDLCLNSFSTNSVFCLGSCQKHADDDIQLTVDDRVVAMETLLKLSNKYPNKIFATGGPLAEVRLWRNMKDCMYKDSKLQGAPTYREGGHLNACNVFFSSIYIQSDGLITPCSMLPHIELGKINSDSLQEAWLNSPIMNELRSRHRISLADFKFCQGCIYMPYCPGGCPALALSLTGELDHPSPETCLRMFLERGGRLP